MNVIGVNNVKLNRKKYDLACARACMTAADVLKESGVPRGTLNTALSRSTSPATLGKIARALGVDVLDILDDAEGGERA